MRQNVKKLLISLFWVLPLFFPAGQCHAVPSESERLAEEIVRLSTLVEQLQLRVAELERRLEEREGPVLQKVPEQKIPSATTTGVPPQWAVHWKNGLRVESADEAHAIKMGGRIMYDAAFFDQDREVTNRFGPTANGSEFRRSRLFVSGRLHRQVEFKAQYDFAGGQSAFKDVYIGLVKIPVVGGLRVGHVKEPFGLEIYTSSKYITFMERALPNVFSPERNNGLIFHNRALEDRLTWSGGAFRDSDSAGDATSGNFNFTGRLTGLPWYQDGGEKLLHLGLGYSRRRFAGRNLAIAGRPEAHLARKWVDTGRFPAQSMDLLGLEAALVYGSASLQTEFMQSDFEAPDAAHPTFRGFYLQGSYFLSGEHRRYGTSDGAFGRVRPKRNLFEAGGGPGAWEAAIRYSRLDLDGGILQGGQLDNLTLGLNWYLNPIARVMWNYVNSQREAVGGANIFQMRFQIDF